MTEALNCVGEGVYQPEERFLIEFQMKLRLWKENQN